MSEYSESIPSQPVFRPLRAKFKPLGMNVGQLLGTIAVCLCGAGLAYLLGGWTYPAEEAVDDAEIADMAQEYAIYQRELSSYEAALEVSEEGQADVDTSSIDMDAVEAAYALGIEADMSDEELEALVPSTQTVDKPRIPTFLRYVLLVALPGVVLAALFIEIGRTCLLTTIKRIVGYNRREHVLRNRPLSYRRRALNQEET